MKSTLVILAIILLAVLSGGAISVSVRKDKDISNLRATVDAQGRTIETLSEFALSKVYLDRLAGNEAQTAALLGDVYLADLALSERLPDQIRREFLIFAYSAYEDLKWRQLRKLELSPRFKIPELDWSSEGSLKAGFQKFNIRKRAPTTHAGFLWIAPKDGVDAITGASLDVPRIMRWSSHEAFRAAFDSYRYRPTGIIAQRKNEAQQSHLSDAPKDTPEE